MTEQLKLTNQLCHRFYKANNAITRAYRPLLSDLQITYPQYLVLMSLWERQPLEVGQIKAVTQIDGGALTLILKKLVTKNYVRLSTSEEDKRVKMASLTNEGQALEQKATEIPEKLMGMFPGLTIKEFKELKSLMDRLLIGVDAG